MALIWVRQDPINLPNFQSSSSQRGLLWVAQLIFSAIWAQHLEVQLALTYRKQVTAALSKHS
jgi:hypothetical protein